MRLAAAIFALLALASCQREPATVAPKGNISVAVDTQGKITLNGEPVTEEQLQGLLIAGSASALVEKDAAGKTTVTVNGKKMTAEEFAAYRHRNEHD